MRKNFFRKDLKKTTAKQFPQMRKNFFRKDLEKTTAKQFPKMRKNFFRKDREKSLGTEKAVGYERAPLARRQTLEVLLVDETRGRNYSMVFGAVYRAMSKEEWTARYGQGRGRMDGAGALEH